MDEDELQPETPEEELPEGAEEPDGSTEGDTGTPDGESAPSEGPDAQGGDEYRARAEHAERLLQEYQRRDYERSQQASTTQQREAQAQADPEPDPFTQPREWYAWQRRHELNQAAQYEAQREQREFQTRAYYSEQMLRQAGEFDEFRSLVNLDDPNNRVRQFLERNPNVHREVWNHPAPAHRLLEIGRDLQVLDPAYRAQLIEQEIAKRQGQAVQQVLAKQKPGVSPPKGTIAQMKTRPTSRPAQKDPREMTEAELDAEMHRIYAS